MQRLFAVLPKTAAAAERARRQAADGTRDSGLAGLLAAVAVVEAHHACLGPTAIPAQSMRQLVIAATAAAGRPWLTARHDERAVAAFTALYAAPAPPELPVLDQVLADLLERRYRANLQYR